MKFDYKVGDIVVHPKLGQPRYKIQVTAIKGSTMEGITLESDSPGYVVGKLHTTWAVDAFTFFEKYIDKDVIIEQLINLENKIINHG